MADEAESVEHPLSAAQRSKIRRQSRFRTPDVGEEGGELNIVPYLDIIMNIIVFVIASLSVVFMSTIQTTPPSIGGGKKGGGKIKSKALNLTALITSEGISLKTAGGNIATGCDRIGPGVTIPLADNRYDYAALARCVRELKTQNEDFAGETQVTITANPGIEYQIVVASIDALRKDDKGALFPDVYFGVAR
ncbi:MAG: biopolymer transporter ExbD [Deltaproteobacteria bacterium]|nr:biopolymer transporter ExbD [Deltaproteobacteria bacterium]